MRFEGLTKGKYGDSNNIREQTLTLKVPPSEDSLISKVNDIGKQIEKVLIKVDAIQESNTTVLEKLSPRVLDQSGYSEED